MSKNGESIPASKNQLHNDVRIRSKQGKLGQIPKWREVPTKVIYHTETVKQVTMKSGRVATVVSLVDENGTSLKAFTTSCFEKDLVNFGLGEDMVHQTFEQASELQKPRLKLLPL